MKIFQNVALIKEQFKKKKIKQINKKTNRQKALLMVVRHAHVNAPDG